MNDMTTGSPLKILVTFSLPMLISMIFQQMYSVVDTIVAGRFISANALAAVGASYPITTLFIAFATGASVGCSVVVSQMFGRKDYREGQNRILYGDFVHSGAGCCADGGRLIDRRPACCA